MLSSQALSYGTPSCGTPEKWVEGLQFFPFASARKLKLFLETFNKSTPQRQAAREPWQRRRGASGSREGVALPLSRQLGLMKCWPQEGAVAQAWLQAACMRPGALLGIFTTLAPESWAGAQNGVRLGP